MPLLPKTRLSTTGSLDGGDGDIATVDLQKTDVSKYDPIRIEILEFLPDCGLTDTEKQAWFVEARGFGHEICLRPGRNDYMGGSYILTTTMKLTTAGFSNIALRQPSPKAIKRVGT